MDNKIIVLDKNILLQKRFMDNLKPEPREKIKKAILNKIDTAIKEIVILRIDISRNGVNPKIYDKNFKDTLDILDPLLNTIDHINFIINSEYNRILKKSKHLEDTAEEKKKEIKIKE